MPIKNTNQVTMRILNTIFLVFIITLTTFSQIPKSEDSLKIFLQVHQKDKTYIVALKDYALKLMIKGKYEQMDSLATIMNNIIEENKFTKEKFYLNQVKGEILTAKSDGRAALPFFTKCRQIAEEFKDKTLLLNALKNIANAYRYMGDNNNQMKYALEGIEILEKNPEIMPDPNPYIFVGNILVEADEFDRAVPYYQKAKEILTKTNNERGMATLENRIGNLYYLSFRPKLAFPHYKKGLEIAQKTDFKIMQAILSLNVGNVYKALKNNIEAEAYYKKSELVCRELKSANDLRNVCNKLGELYQEQKKYELAEKYYLEVAELDNKIGNPEFKKRAYQHLADFYGETKQFEKAYTYAQKALISKDSVFIVQNANKVQELLTKYEFEKKESQIKLLNQEKRNADLQRNALLIGGILVIFLTGFIIFSLQNKNKLNRLEENQKLRNRISADLHDEIGSTLSSISILSEIVAMQQKKGEFKPEIMQQVSYDAREVIEKMDDIIWTINPENDTFNNLETRLKSFAIPMFESKEIEFVFDFSFELLNTKINMEKRREIYLILKEAINNLVKYSQCKNAMIAAQITGSKIWFTIKDDGIGFDTNVESNRNGLRNMKMRAEKIKADLNIKSEVGSGTEINLVLVK